MEDRQVAFAVTHLPTIYTYRAKIRSVPGSGCAWWSGAISGAGHGRFWLGGGRVVIAHRFGFALAFGVAALMEAGVLSHGCDNPLCQRIDPEHVHASTALRNRREWAARRNIAGWPLSDPRGSRIRARTHRDMIRCDPRLVVVDREAVLRRTGLQQRLFLGVDAGPRSQPAYWLRPRLATVVLGLHPLAPRHKRLFGEPARSEPCVCGSL